MAYRPPIYQRYQALKDASMPAVFLAGTQHDNIAVILSEAKNLPSGIRLWKMLRQAQHDNIAVILSKAKNLPAGIRLWKMLRQTQHDNIAVILSEAKNPPSGIRLWKMLRQAQHDNITVILSEAKNLPFRYQALKDPSMPAVFLAGTQGDNTLAKKSNGVANRYTIAAVFLL